MRLQNDVDESISHREVSETEREFSLGKRGILASLHYSELPTPHCVKFRRPVLSEGTRAGFRTWTPASYSPVAPDEAAWDHVREAYRRVLFPCFLGSISRCSGGLPIGNYNVCGIGRFSSKGKIGSLTIFCSWSACRRLVESQQGQISTNFIFAEPLIK